MDDKKSVDVEVIKKDKQLPKTKKIKKSIPKKKKEVKFVSTISNQKRKNIIGYLFLLPWIIGAVLFALIPSIITIVMSFANIKTDVLGWGFYFTRTSDGAARNLFSNYISTFTNPQVLISLRDFIGVELLYVPVIVIMAFILALILSKNIRFKGFFRTIFFLPVVIISGPLIKIILGLNELTQGQSTVTKENPLISSFIYRMIASYSFSVANVISTLFENFVMILWLTGIPIILFINAINKINKDLYEAARIDGANSWQMLWKITIPNCLYVAFIVSVFSIVQISTLPISPFYLKIADGINNASNGTLGLAATYSIINLVVILLLIGIFAIVFLPRRKKSKEVLTLVQVEQLRDTKMRNKDLFKKDKRKGGI